MENDFEKEFSVYSNPESSVLNITTPKQTQFSIFNAHGEEIFTETITNVISIDISRLNSGEYFVKDNKTGTTIPFTKVKA